MAAIQEIVSSNEGLGKAHKPVTAVFSGATHGIGLETLRAFLKHIPNPNVVLVGRNETKFAPELETLRAVNTAATISFIEADLSLIREVDRAAEAIASQLPANSIQLLCMSQGYAPLGPRTFSAEGLDDAMSVAIYGRNRLAERLLVHGMMATSARLVSVLAGAHEGHLFLNDLELKTNYKISNLRGHFASLQTLAFDRLAKQYPDVGFVHIFPGTVDTGLPLRGPNMSFAIRTFARLYTLWIYRNAMTPQESGERTLQVCFEGKFDRGSLSMDWDQRLSESKELVEYREKPEVEEAVWKHLEELFARAYGR